MKNKNLAIFSLCEDNIDQFYTWCGKNRNYDILVNNYGNTSNFLKEKVEYYTEIKGYKYKNIFNIFQTMYKDIIHYEYFIFPDPDLKVSTSEINLLFELSKFYNLDLSAPSQSGFISHELMRHDEDNSIAYKVLNMIEIQCPVFSRLGLLVCLWTFNISNSAWGLDWVWPRLVKTLSNNDNFGVINSIITEHTKPNESLNLKFSNGKTPTLELEELFKNFGIIKNECKLIKNVYKNNKIFLS